MWVHYFPPRETEPQHLDGAYLRKLAVTGSEGKLVLLERHRGTASSQGKWAQMQAPGELGFSQWLIHCSLPARPRCDVRRASWEGHTRCRSRSLSGTLLCPPRRSEAGRLGQRNQLPWHNRQTAWGHRASCRLTKGRVPGRGGIFFPKKSLITLIYNKQAIVVRFRICPFLLGWTEAHWASQHLV